MPPLFCQATGGAGSFVYWARNGVDYESKKPYPRAGSAVDGSKTIHAAVPFQVHTTPPMLDKSIPASLRFEGNDTWMLRSNGSIVQKYKTNDLRISLVYRARCFANEAEAASYRQEGDMTIGGPAKQMLSLEDVLGTLGVDLARRGLVSSAEAALKMDRLEYAMLLLDTYLVYPTTDAWLPINYCALGRLVPALDPVVRLFC